MEERLKADPVGRRRRLRSTVLGLLLALAIAFSVYVLLSSIRPGSAWLASLWFLALLPAVLSALICYIGDPECTRSTAFYWQMPLVLCGLVCAGSAIVLHEGVICMLMLSPIWLVSGWVGAFALRSQRRRRGRSVESSFLIIPLLAAVVEAQAPMPHEPVAVTRTVHIAAAASDVWPYAVSSHRIGAHEGRWTVTHNLIGLPRPRESVIDRDGVGAVRTAYWGDNINFQERVIDWRPGHKLGWRFDFNNDSLQAYTDKHISPDGVFLKIDSGDYTLRQAPDGATELTLTTRYIAKTHVNPYAKLWGELLMGDVEDNVLTIIKDRAERASEMRRGLRGG